MAMHPHSIPKPRKYLGHYDIADRTFQLLSRHRAAACILFWSLTILLDILLQLPIEWFFLFYFILALVFRIFFIGGHIVLISIGAMCVSNAVVFYTVPFSFTSPFATGVAFGLMVSLIHGLNLKGVILAMTMYMLKPYLERQTVIAALNPPTVPSIVFLAPLAAFCSAFGVLWLLYDLFGYLHASTDDLRDFFGITLPAPSIVTLKDVKDRSIALHWQCSSQATISKHLIEIDGLLIGESGKQETSVVIQGLYPDNTYRIRSAAAAQPLIGTEADTVTPAKVIQEEQIAALRAELEQKEALYSQLTQQLTDLEKSCKSQDELLRNEIAVLREQQKQEEEPRQQAKAKLRELQENLREAEATKTKTEKEHRAEVDKRQRLTDQLTAKRRKIEQLQQTLRQNEERLVAEKESRLCHVRELESTLRKRSNDVKEAESELHKMQASQKSLILIIEAKEKELQKMQPTLQIPKGLVVLEQKNKELDLKCAQLSQLLAQYKAENQELQDRLTKAAKNVSAARKANEEWQAKTEADSKLVPTAVQPMEEQCLEKMHDTYEDQAALDQGSNWMSSGWGQSPGTRILNGLFRDDGLSLGSKAMSPRKTAGAPPGFPQRGNSTELLSETGPFGLGRGFSGPIGGLDSATVDIKESANSDPPFMKSGEVYGRTSTDSRSRTSSISSMTGYQSPLFEPAFAFSNTTQIYQSSLPPRQTQMRHQQSAHQQQPQHQGHAQSPGSRHRFQDGLLHSPPISHAQPHWGVSNGVGPKNGCTVNGGAIGRSPVLDNITPSNPQQLDYHLFFSPMGAQDISTGGLDHQLNEQSVIQSMFESPDPLDLRQHLRTVGSHSSLNARNTKILPSHLRTISTPGTSSPLSSPTSAVLPPFQPSPTWDFKPIARPGTLSRMSSQTDSGSKFLNGGGLEMASPSSPHLLSASPPSTGFTRPLARKESDRGVNVWGGYGTVNRSQERFDAPLDLVSDPWGQQGEMSSRPPLQQSRLQNITTLTNNNIIGGRSEPGSGSAGMEGMLSSPTGSSVSSLDTSTPRSVDALVFADHYFSHRNNRGFDTLSTLPSGSMGAKPLGAEGPVSKMMGHNNRRSETLSSSPRNPLMNDSGPRETSSSPLLETSVFGYGLKLNPFGWSLPLDESLENNDSSGPKSDMS
ncbi:hypothetical protein BGZ83_001855 [Gryganskiella cystojenkinii]|nr:hypothetical protein BGZ83_001855 [Gryganskiella cystojenkinii]